MEVPQSSNFTTIHSRPIRCGFLGTTRSGVPLVDHNDLTVKLDPVSCKQLTSTTSLDFTVYEHFAPLNGHFFTTVSHKGAFDPDETAWTSGWTVLSHNNIFKETSDSILYT